MKLVNTNRYYLAGTRARGLHLATVHYGTREFMAFADCLTQRIYIEEIIGGQLVFISDEPLAHALSQFLLEHDVLLMNRPLLPDSVWLRPRP